MFILWLVWLYVLYYLWDVRLRGSCFTKLTHAEEYRFQFSRIRSHRLKFINETSSLFEWSLFPQSRWRRRVIWFPHRSLTTVFKFLTSCNTPTGLPVAGAGPLLGDWSQLSQALLTISLKVTATAPCPCADLNGHSETWMRVWVRTS